MCIHAGHKYSTVTCSYAVQPALLWHADALEHAHTYVYTCTCMVSAKQRTKLALLLIYTSHLLFVNIHSIRNHDGHVFRAICALSVHMRVVLYAADMQPICSRYAAYMMQICTFPNAHKQNTVKPTMHPWHTVFILYCIHVPCQVSRIVCMFWH